MSKYIESKDLEIRSLFQEYYVVPDYQRDYVWGERSNERPVDEVELFLNDIYSEFEEHSQKNPTEYFIGTIITCENKNGSYDVIDGQQRLTTIFLTVCAIRDAMAKHSADTRELDAMISQVSTDSFGKQLKRNRLILQYSDSGDILDSIVSNEVIDEESLTTRSTKNIYNCYKTVENFLLLKFKDKISEIQKFNGYFLKQIKLINVETPNLKKALIIFATINDRGVGLDAMDLLKNLMFINANQNQFAQLKDKWKALTDTIYSANEKPLRFLRYFILADYATETRIREDDAYEWFQENRDKIGYSDDPIRLVDSLIGAAKSYKNFRSGKTPNGTSELALSRIQRLGGSSVRQPYILLLAGRHLQKEQFSQLATMVENLFALWLVTGTQSKVTEPEIVKLARILTEVQPTDHEAFKKFLSHVETNIIKSKAKDFTRAMMNLHQWHMPKYRMKYFLAKVTQFIEQQAFNVKAANADLDTYLESSVEIEHIHPLLPSDKAVEEFGDNDEDEFYRRAMGNLLLLDKSRNVIARNHPFSQKQKIYAESNFMLSQYLAKSPEVGKTDQISRTFENHMESFSKWTPSTVLERQKMLVKIAHEVWNVPLEYKELPVWDLPDSDA
jgi:uncharacterized protein with ParB-like and HNH nuclease domain